MSDKETIFKADETLKDVNTEGDNQAPLNTPAPIEIPQELQELVGEGKKYATLNDALKSIPHAQTHIQTLTGELAVSKEELTKRKTTEELIAQIKSDASKATGTPEAPSIDINSVGNMVDERLANIENAKTASSNATQVADAFVAKFGDKAEEVYNSMAVESGLTVEALNKLTASSPKAVLKLAGLNAVQPFTQKSSGDVNTETRTANNDGTLTSKLPKGASTKDVTAAWKTAGQIVKNRNNT
jgi:hypothetical protein